MALMEAAENTLIIIISKNNVCLLKRIPPNVASVPVEFFHNSPNF